MILRAATRGSPLALWQTRDVARRLAQASAGSVRVTEVVVETTGDRRQDLAIHQIGGQGVFVKEVQSAVLDGRADFAVHSAKDLPPRTAPGLRLAAVPERADPRDALVGRALDDLPAGARVATGSVRRRAQLAWIRPDLSFTNLRGNIATRLTKLGEVDVVVVAYAALLRLGRQDEAAEVLSTMRLLPQVGQGAMALECRDDDVATQQTLAAIEHGPTRVHVDAERAFLDALGGACDLPVGALASGGPDRLEIEGLVASPDGRVVLRRRLGGPMVEPTGLGAALARELLDNGGSDLLGRS